MPELEKSLDDTDVITKLFKRRKDDMKVKYGKFCINQPKAEFILTEFDAFFNVSTISYSKIQHTFLIWNTYLDSVQDLNLRLGI